MVGDKDWLEQLYALDDLAMGYEVAVIHLLEDDYLSEFYDLFEVRGREARLVPSDEGFEQTLRAVCGERRWEVIAQRTEGLYGLPSRVMVFDDVAGLKDELEGPDGLAPFFFVFDLMFCEYEGFALCFMSGTNN